MSNKQRVGILSTEFLPKNEYVLVKPVSLEKEQLTAGGIVIAINQSSLSRPTIGVVVEVGKDIEDIAKGDTILWPETDGLDFEFIDGEFMLLRYKSIIGSKKA